jgi:repressor LexA
MTTATQPQPISDATRRVYDAIVAYIDAKGFSPSVRELCTLTGISSPNGVNNHLLVLEGRGWITRQAKAARTIRIREVANA